MRFSINFMATIFYMSATVFGQGEFETFFCKDLDGNVAASNNFCESANGNILASPGFCCIRSSDFDTITALSAGCGDNGLLLGSNDAPCSP
ncbi:hypothetical protein F5883DRAFT_650684 [Diaporthe sp. PMI_573]|nr:hypothetical protein F5883DRAFT_650684 [Diaporthaceae sp. PMI_573]